MWTKTERRTGEQALSLIPFFPSIQAPIFPFPQVPVRTF
jgi:hypothetical protein